VGQARRAQFGLRLTTSWPGLSKWHSSPFIPYCLFFREGLLDSWRWKTYIPSKRREKPVHTASYPRTPTPWTTSHLAFSCNVPHTCFAKLAIYFSSVVYFTADLQARIFTTFLIKFRDSSVGIVTRLRAARPRSPDSVHSTGINFSSPERPDQARDWPIFLSSGYRWSLPAVKQAVREADLSRMRVRGAWTPLTLASSYWDN